MPSTAPHVTAVTCESLEPRCLLADIGFAITAGSTEVDHGQHVAADHVGNVVVAGTFQSTADFQPGASRTELSSAGGADVFVAHYSVRGKLIWARRFGGAGDETVTGVKVDPNGNVIVAGTFTGTVDFDPGPGVQNRTSTIGHHDVFIVKLDPAGGLVWAGQIGGGDGAVGDLDLDAVGNPILTGWFSGVWDFNPTPARFNVTATGGRAGYVLQLSVNGRTAWVTQMGGLRSGGTEHLTASAVAVDALGDIYVAGDFFGTVDTDPAPQSQYLLGGPGVAGGFLAKLDHDGRHLWTRSLNGPGSVRFSDIAVDGARNVYCTGSFDGRIHFDPAGGALLNGRRASMFVVRINRDGSYQWVKQFGALEKDSYTDYAISHGIAVAPDGSVYTTGTFRGTVDFDPGPGRKRLISYVGDVLDTFDVFISRLSTNGRFIDAWYLGHYRHNVGSAVAAAGGRVYVTGTVEKRLLLHIGRDEPPLLKGAGRSDMFLLQLLA